jgi:hypothetical protein
VALRRHAREGVVRFSAIVLGVALGSAGANAMCGPKTSAPAPAAVSEANEACANMERLGCSYGADPVCPGRVGLAVSENHTTAAAVLCASRAATLAALTACDPYFACSLAPPTGAEFP